MRIETLQRVAILVNNQGRVDMQQRLKLTGEAGVLAATAGCFPGHQSEPRRNGP